MYGPDYYTDPPEPEIGLCECGESEEDCWGDCYPYSILQLPDPETGEFPMSIHQEPEDPRIAQA